MCFSDFLTLLQTWGPVFGPALGILIYVLWRDTKREDRLAKRIDKLEEEQRTVILPIVKEYAALVERNTAVLMRLENILSRCLHCEYQEAHKILERLVGQDTSDSHESA